TSGLTSLLNFYNITEPTWLSQESSSQIDNIWVNYRILLYITEPKLKDTIDLTRSDHKITVREYVTQIDFI
ncbi:41251_t:CDS:1, partial [Gigaspora margarita]